jgi:hypothetical protein
MHHPLLHSFAFAGALLFSLPSQALVDGIASTDFLHLGTVGAGGLDGVLIAPNWVLTAAHVAGSATTFQSGYGSAAVDAAYRAPGAAFPSNDIALLHLATPIAADLFPTLASVALSSGDASAYGAVTAAVAGSGGQFYAWSVLTGAIDSAESDSGATLTVHYLAVAAAANGSALLQGGDSGSALFAGQAEDSAALLLGIASATGNATSYYVQPAAYREWMDATMAASGQHALWSAAPVPEPGTIALWLAGLACVAGARRRTPPVVHLDHPV